MKALRDLLLADLRRPVVITGVARRVGLRGMAGIGKSVLANALVRDRRYGAHFLTACSGFIWVGKQMS